MGHQVFHCNLLYKWLRNSHYNRIALIDMIGKPKYKLGDKVLFDVVWQNDAKYKIIGTIEIIDAYGTFEQKKEVSYDIMVDNFLGSGTAMFFKHITEPNLELVSGDAND